jgi:PEP-CTERM motif
LAVDHIQERLLNNHLFTSLVLGAAAVAAAPAFAATTTYTTPASFLAQVAAGAYTNAFTGAPNTQPSFSFSDGGFAYTVSAPEVLLNDATYLSGTFIGNLYSNATLTVTFTGGNPTAVGGEFFISDVNDRPVSAEVTVTLSDGTTTTYTPNGPSDGFRGFISNVAITSLTMSAPGLGFYNTIDNLIVGTAVAAVPEAGTWLMMGLGLAGLALVRRQQRA